MKVLVAAAAVRLTLRLNISRYDRLTEIILYPYEAFKAPHEDEWRTGEVNRHFGTVVFSWPALQAGFKNPQDSYNVGYHEFAHVLDRADGHFDGTPLLKDKENYNEWIRVMAHHFLQLRKEAPKQLKVLDFYGATDEAEFFAVATESFFENPEKLKQYLPRLVFLTFRLLPSLARKELERQQTLCILLKLTNRWI